MWGSALNGFGPTRTKFDPRGRGVLVFGVKRTAGFSSAKSYGSDREYCLLVVTLDLREQFDPNDNNRSVRVF